MTPAKITFLKGVVFCMFVKLSTVLLLQMSYSGGSFIVQSHPILSVQCSIQSDNKQGSRL